MDASEGPTLVVVKNNEDQYSIWREGRKIPDGWEAAGPSGSKEVCLDYIEEVWTDMRPRSLRESQSAGGPTAVAKRRPEADHENRRVISK